MLPEHASKVVLGGRPTVFLSSEEYQEALHGRRRVLGNWKAIPGWPEFQEVHLKHFSEAQIGAFATAYLSAKRDDNARERVLVGGPRELLNFYRRQARETIHVGIAASPVEDVARGSSILAWRDQFLDRHDTLLRVYRPHHPARDGKTVTPEAYAFSATAIRDGVGVVSVAKAVRYRHDCGETPGQPFRKIRDKGSRYV